jgi:hypothetical protein
MSTADIVAVTAKFRQLEGVNADLQKQLAERTLRLSEVEAELTALKLDAAEREKKNEVIVA